MKKYENVEKKQFIFDDLINTKKGILIEFPKNITISEMKKAAFSKLLLNSKSSRILGTTLSDKSKINELVGHSHFIIDKINLLTKHWIL